MPKSPLIFRLKRLSAGGCFFLVTMVTVQCAFSQTAVVGYTSVLNGTVPSSPYTFLSFASTGTIMVVPFAFNSTGDYTLASTLLLLRAVPLQGGTLPVDDNPAHGGTPGSGGATFETNNVSVRVFSALPTSLTLPTPLVTLSAVPAGVGESPTIISYAASSTPTLTAAQTYYMAISVGGTLEWDMTTGASSSGTYPGNNPVTTLVSDGAPLVYYMITSGGVQSLYGNVGGFAITANSVSPIPEPATVSVFAGAGILAVALIVRRRCSGIDAG